MAYRCMAPKARAVKKSQESQEVLDRLEAYLKDAQEEPIQFLLRFWKDQITAITYKELMSIIIDEQEAEKIFADWFQDYSILVKDKLRNVWTDAMAGAVEENLQLQTIGFRFHTSQENVIEWMEEHGARLVTNCMDEQREAIKFLSAQALKDHMTVDEFARYVRPTIGLTRQQAGANHKLYQSVKEKLQSDHPRMKPESIERKAREAAAKYAEKQHHYRAQTIAQTEIVTAYHEGNDMAIRQAIEEDKMPSMHKVWSTSLDGEVCPTCQAMEGMEVDMDGEFHAKRGKKLLTIRLPPAHPRCACAVRYIENSKETDNKN